jgi:hypothetical protein
MKRIILGAIIGVMITAGAALAGGMSTIFNKDGVICMTQTSSGIRSVACGLKTGGYMVGINKYWVAVSNNDGKMIYKKIQPNQ